MYQLLAALIPLVFLYAYMLFTSIEYGTSFFLLFPKILRNDILLKQAISPIWETTNVFLVFTIICIFTFFPKSTYFFGTNLIVPLLIAFLFLGVRSACMLFLFYGDMDSKLIRIVFFLSCFLAPLFFSSGFVYMITGNTTNLFLQNLNLPIYALVLSNILLISGSFYQFYSKNKSDFHLLRRILSFSYVIFVLSLILFMYDLIHTSSWMLLSDANLHIYSSIIIFLLLSSLVFFVARKHLLLFLTISLLMGAVLFFFALLHLPYLIYPSITIYNAFTDLKTFQLMLWSFGIGMVFVIPSLIFLYILLLKE